MRHQQLERQEREEMEAFRRIKERMDAELQDGLVMDDLRLWQDRVKLRLGLNMDFQRLDDNRNSATLVAAMAQCGAERKGKFAQVARDSGMGIPTQVIGWASSKHISDQELLMTLIGSQELIAARPMDEKKFSGDPY